MSHPVRLLDEGASEFERELLGSWQSQQPSAAARRRALALAGSGAVTTIAASAGAEVLPQLGLGAVAKWLGIGVVAGLVTSAAALGVVDSNTTIASPERVAAVAPTPVAMAAAPTIAPAQTTKPTVEPATAPDRTQAPSVVIAKPRSAAIVVQPEPIATSPRGGLGPETILLDRAREALRSGNAARALELVGQYQSQFPDGVLAQEAAVLRIDALDQQGKRAEAKRSAEQFLTKHPRSAHADRLQRLSDDPKNP
jgi:TolA-binding protein